MYLILTFIGIYLIILLLCVINNIGDKRDYILGWGDMIVWFVVVVIVFCISNSVSKNRHEITSYEFHDLEIESAYSSDQWGVTGTIFILGHMQGGSYSTYVVMGKFNQGLKKLELRSHSYYVREEEGTPKIINYYCKRFIELPKSRWYLGSYEREPETGWYRNEHDNKVIIVPPKTVTKVFQIK